MYIKNANVFVRFTEEVAPGMDGSGNMVLSDLLSNVMQADCKKDRFGPDGLVIMARALYLFGVSKTSVVALIHHTAVAKRQRRELRVGQHVQRRLESIAQQGAGRPAAAQPPPEQARQHVPE